MDDESTGIFSSLSEAISGLTDQIEDQIKQSPLGAIGALGGQLMDNVKSAFGFAPKEPAAQRSGGSSPGSATKALPILTGELGALAAQGESGSLGSKAIGYDKTGGTSYGKYQIAAGQGSMHEFLKFAEKKGGDGVEIAQRMRAAGPFNTGSKQGAAVDEWKKLEAEGKLGTLEHDFIKSTHFDPAFNKIQNEDLRTRIQGSKTLQEVLWSTAVQHGPGGRGRGASDIFNQVYKEGMSDEEVVKAVYQNRSGRFGSSSTDTQKSVNNRFSRESNTALALLEQEKNTPKPASVAESANATLPASLEGSMSSSFAASTQNAMDRGVRYSFGSKNSKAGGIDCSGWVSEMGRTMMEDVNSKAGKEVFGKEAKAVLQKGSSGGAAGIISTVGKATGEILTNGQLSPETVKEGMMIGMDTGDKGWDRGRDMGIDHIVQTYRDQLSGKMMVSESQGGKGVTNTEYAKWYERNQKRGAKLFGVDPTKLASVEEPQSINAEQLTAQADLNTTPALQPEAREIAQPAESRYQQPESIQDISPPQPQMTDMSAVVALLSQLVEVTAKSTVRDERDSESKSRPNIPVEFDDAYSINLSHDRV